MSSLLVGKPRSAPPREALTTAIGRRSPFGRKPSVRSRELFPLPLSPFEHLFLLEDSPSYPIQFFGRLRFRGRIQQHVLNHALGIALARHPLLTAIVQSGKDGRAYWTPCLDFVPAVHCLNQEPAEEFPSANRLDIHGRPGLQVSMVLGSERSDLVLQFHHAACDGVGALDFTTDLLTAYANALGNTNRFRFKPLDTGRLRSRAALPISGWRLWRWAIQRLPDLPAFWTFYRRKPAPFIPHRPRLDDPTPPPMFPEICVHRFSREESAALGALAQGSENSLNSLLARDLFVALNNWRGRNGLPSDVCLRLMLPINMRTPADRRMPAANVVSTAYMDHCPEDCLDGEALLERINRLMENIKRNHFGLAWLVALPFLQRMTHAWGKARRSRRRCLYSALLTNLGPVLASSPLPRKDRHIVVGDAILEAVDFVPVTRPLQCLGLAVSNYAGVMSLGMRYDSRVLSSQQARDVLGEYVRVLGASIRSSGVCGHSPNVK